MNKAVNGLDWRLMAVMGVVMPLDRAHILWTYENKQGKGHY